MGLDRHKGFGVGVFAQLFGIGRHSLPADCARAILPGHHLVGRDEAQCTQHFDLFIAHRRRIETRGRLHCHQRQQLQDVVLHHVAHRARAVVVADPRFKADRLGDSDLHMVEMRGIPKRLEQDIGKAQRQQVLHRFLAQIVVDAEGPLLREGAGNGVVDLAAGFKAGAQRLFKADPARLAGQAAGFEARNGRFEQAGRGRQEDGEAGARRADLGSQRGELVGLVGVQRLIA